MGDLVHAIISLCKLLDYLIDVSIKPDYFRLSKLNRLNSDEILLFWTVLHKMCCFSAANACKEDPTKCIFNYLMKEGRVVTYALPPEASPRQLLLCFGWLLSHGVIETIIDKLILNTPLGEELPFKPDTAEPEPLMRLCEDSPQTVLNYALLLSGQIHQGLKAVATYRQERAQLIAKIHKTTSGFQGLPHLSVGDVQLLTSPELLPDFLTRCRPCLQILEAYSKWQRKSQVFWKWMESILKEEESLLLNKSLSVTELSHLNTFLKTLENDVRSRVMSEHQAVAEEAPVQLTTQRMKLCDDTGVLDYAMETLTSKIQSLTVLNEKKKQKFQEKLQNSEQLQEKANVINIILNKFGLNAQSQSGLESDSTSQLSGSVEDLSLEKTSKTFTINKLLLE